MSKQRKAIFVTGGGSGIGRAVARHFASEGWYVGLADVSEEGLAATAALLAPGQSGRYVMDVTDRGQWQVALDGFGAASGGRLDVLFNNAGIGGAGDLEDVDPQLTDHVIAVNLGGVINGARMGLPLLKATPGSCLLNTCSGAGLYGGAGMAVYSASKFGVRGLTEALDVEWMRHGIKVRSLMPGYIDTPLLDQDVAGTDLRVRDSVATTGLEFTPMEQVAEAAWEAVHGDGLHYLVGETAKWLSQSAREDPAGLRKMMAEGQSLV